MLKEIKTKAELDLLMNKSFSLYRMITKESGKRFFFIKSDDSSCNSIQDVTSLVNEEDIKSFIFPLDIEIFDYVIKNKIVDMEDIDYSDTMGLEYIVKKYPKIIEFIDNNTLDSIFYGENLDIYELSRRSALEICTSKYFIPKIGKEEVLKEIDSDNDFCKDQKEYLKEFISKNVI